MTLNFKFLPAMSLLERSAVATGLFTDIRSIVLILDEIIYISIKKKQFYPMKLIEIFILRNMKFFQANLMLLFVY